MDEMQAAVLNVLLKHIDSWNQSRSVIAQKYFSALKDLPLQLPVDKAEGSIFHLFVIRTKDRDKLASYLLEQGIQTDVHYPVPDHTQPIMTVAKYHKEDLSNTEAFAKEILTLPCYPELALEEIDFVIEKIKLFAATKPSATVAVVTCV